MESFWKWLMHANARALFVIALLILLLVLGWCAWVIGHPRQPAPPDVAHAKQPAAYPETTLGILACISNESNAAAWVLPVNPFRPTLESLAANNEPISNILRVARLPNRAVTNDDPFAAMRGTRNVPVGTGSRNVRPAAGAPASVPVAPVLTYRGYFQRPDGKFAALFHDSAAQTASFYVPGDEFNGVALLATGITHARVRLPGGQERDLAIGDRVQLAPEAKP